LHPALLKSRIAGAIAIYLFFIPLDFIDIANIGSATKLIVFIPLMFSIFYLKSTRIENKKAIFLLIFYTVLNLLSMFFSNRWSVSVSAFSSLALNIGILIFISLFNYNEKEILFLRKTLVFSGFIIITLFIFSGKSNEIGRKSIELLNSDQNSNYINGYLLFSQANSFNEFLKKKSKWQLFIYVLFLTASFMTGSRGGILADCIILVSLVIFNKIVGKGMRKKMLGIVTILFFITIFILSFFYFTPDIIKNRLTLSYITEDQGGGRFLIWESMIDAYRKFSLPRKLFGVGIGTSMYYAYNGFYAAHNAFLAILLDIGIVGVLIYISILSMFLKFARKVNDYAAESCLIGFIVMSMTTTFTNFKPIWSLMLFILINYNNKNILLKKDVKYHSDVMQ
jgi:hypothetical protein